MMLPALKFSLNSFKLRDHPLLHRNPPDNEWSSGELATEMGETQKGAGFRFSVYHAVAESAQRTARTRSVVFCPHAIPQRTLPAVHEILLRTARLLSGAQSPPPDHRRNGRQSHRLLPLSCA